MSLRIITLANHKGGVSKTTSTASIGACMARMGKKVLLIDLDVKQILHCISSPMRMKLTQASLALWSMAHPCQ